MMTTGWSQIRLMVSGELYNTSRGHNSRYLNLQLSSTRSVICKPWASLLLVCLGISRPRLGPDLAGVVTLRLLSTNHPQLNLKEVYVRMWGSSPRIANDPARNNISVK